MRPVWALTRNQLAAAHTVDDYAASESGPDRNAVQSGGAAIAPRAVSSRPTANHPKPDTLVYRLDADSDKAQRASFDEMTDPSTAKLLAGSPKRGQLNRMGPTEVAALVANAPTVSLAIPEVKATSSSQEGDVQMVQLQVTSVRKASWLSLRLGPAEVLGATIDRQEVQDWPAKGANNSTSTTSSWAINLISCNATGVAVTLKPRGKACSVTLADEEYDLPGMVEPRPKDSMAWYGSDYTIVTRQVTIC